MNRFLRALAGAILACATLAPTAALAVSAAPVAMHLHNPTVLDVAPDGTIFYAERFTGQIRMLNPVSGTNRLFFTVPNMSTTRAMGVLGLTLAPGYPVTPFVYVFATRLVGGRTLGQVIRIRDAGGAGTAMRVVFGSPVSAPHIGGPIDFGPDGMLYLMTGEGGNPALAQILDDPAGKILRMTPSGGVPADNPFPGSRLYAYGLRNSFGITFDPRSGHLWEAENGPRCNDELNLIQSGGNFGWGPHQSCSSPLAAPANTNRDGPSPVLPLRWYTPPIAPTGAAFCVGCGLGAGSDGALFFGTYNTDELRRVTLTADRLGVASQRVVYRHPLPIFSIEAGPTGTLFFTDRHGIFRLVG